MSVTYSTAGLQLWSSQNYMEKVGGNSELSLPFTLRVVFGRIRFDILNRTTCKSVVIETYQSNHQPIKDKKEKV